MGDGVGLGVGVGWWEVNEAVWCFADCRKKAINPIYSNSSTYRSIHNMHLTFQIAWKFVKEHGAKTVVFCTKFQNDNRKIIMCKGGFTRFAFNMSFGMNKSYIHVATAHW